MHMEEEHALETVAELGYAELPSTLLEFPMGTAYIVVDGGTVGSVGYPDLSLRWSRGTGPPPNCLRSE